MANAKAIAISVGCVGLMTAGFFLGVSAAESPPPVHPEVRIERVEGPTKLIEKRVEVPAKLPVECTDAITAIESLPNTGNALGDYAGELQDAASDAAKEAADKNIKGINDAITRLRASSDGIGQALVDKIDADDHAHTLLTLCVRALDDAR
jgi:hypothetical protein